MKLYLWRGADVLRNYSPGIAGALAPSVEVARQQVKDAIELEIYETYYYYYLTIQEARVDDDFVERMEKDCKFLQDEPEVHENPFAFFKQGGD